MHLLPDPPDLLDTLAQALEMSRDQLVNALLLERMPRLPQRQPGQRNDIRLEVASLPLSLACDDSRKDAEFQARLERAARFNGYPSAKQYVAEVIHLQLCTDELDMVVHPRTGEVVGTNDQWSTAYIEVNEGSPFELRVLPFVPESVHQEAV